MIEELPLVSVVFITYNRMVTLRPTFEAFLANTDYPRDCLELMCCDDGSPSGVQRELHELPFDVYCVSTKRRGLGANANQGLKAATGELILQIQDDWLCGGDPGYLRRAVEALRQVPDIGMVLLNEHPKDLEVLRLENFGEWVVRLYRNATERAIGQVGESGYSDWPHLKRREFVERIGPYLEDRRMWETELDYARRVNAQTRFAVADIVGLNVFSHIGEDHSYNWPWKKRVMILLPKLIVGRLIVRLYYRLKNVTSG